MARILTIGWLASGEGTTLDGLAEAIPVEGVPARIALVVSDRPNAPVLERAVRRGLATSVIPFHGGAASGAGGLLDRALRENGCDLVVLAGFLAILPRPFVEAWAGRVINLHPSLLPKFGGRGMYGAHVHEAVLASGDRESGVSLHVVSAEIDAGAVLFQERFPVHPGDTPATLRERARPLELGLLAEAIRRFADGRFPLPYVEGASPPRDRA